MRGKADRGVQVLPKVQGKGQSRQAEESAIMMTELFLFSAMITSGSLVVAIVSIANTIIVCYMLRRVEKTMDEPKIRDSRRPPESGSSCKNEMC